MGFGADVHSVNSMLMSSAGATVFQNTSPFELDAVYSVLVTGTLDYEAGPRIYRLNVSATVSSPVSVSCVR